MSPRDVSGISREDTGGEYGLVIVQGYRLNNGPAKVVTGFRTLDEVEAYKRSHKTVRYLSRTGEPGAGDPVILRVSPITDEVGAEDLQARVQAERDRREAREADQARVREEKRQERLAEEHDREVRRKALELERQAQAEREAHWRAEAERQIAEARERASAN